MKKNQFASQPEIAARLTKALKEWSENLSPPGLPTSFDAHHEGLFAEHEVIPPLPDAPKTKGAPAGSVKGWLCRNGTIGIQDGALLVTADPKAAKNAKPFIAKTGMMLNGPVTAVIKADAKVATNSSLSWRTKEQPDFLPANTIRFTLPAGSSEQTITLPVAGQAIHIRFQLGDQADGLRLRSIELRPAKGPVDLADFSR